MPSLEHVQAAMMRTIELGPVHLPEGLFGPDRERALLGLKVHANTISHARLVALEDTFPRTRTLLGEERFNELSRRYLGWPEVIAQPLSHIGRHFPPFLEAAGEAWAAAGLAAFEWLWLEAYHAAEAPVLSLTDLAGIDEQALLDLEVCRHPAARLARLDAAACEVLGEDVPGLDGAHGVLLARPHAEVLVSPASAAMTALFACIEAPAAIGNLIDASGEPGGKDRLSPDETMMALIALIEAGALRGQA